MYNGVIGINSKDEKMADYIINHAYPQDVIPISCVLSGSRAYGMNLYSSDRNYLGIHLMDTWECLEHPNFRNIPLVIRKQNEEFSLNSFEMWKFIDLLLKGAFPVYEILYMPVIHHQLQADDLIILCRQALTNKIGKSAKNIVSHSWQSNKRSRKSTVITYYRLLQAIFYLLEEEFQWKTEELWEYAGNLIPEGNDILKVYMNSKTRKDSLSDKELEKATKEINNLINDVERATLSTRLPDKCPKEVLDEILLRVKRTRSSMI